MTWTDWYQRLLGWFGIRREGSAADGHAQEPGMHMSEVGSGNLQIGQVGGSLHMDHSTRSSAVHVTHVTHQHFYAVAAAPAQAPASTPAASNDSGRLTPEQREVFARMKQLKPRTYNKVVAFMRSEFNTGMVSQLNGQQLHRVRRYVETIQRKEVKERA